VEEIKLIINLVSDGEGVVHTPSRSVLSARRGIYYPFAMFRSIFQTCLFFGRNDGEGVVHTPSRNVHTSSRSGVIHTPSHSRNKNPRFLN
jgi:endo-beta-N-acetylglucosaminidase D